MNAKMMRNRRTDVSEEEEEEEMQSSRKKEKTILSLFFFFVSFAKEISSSLVKVELHFVDENRSDKVTIISK